MDLNMEIDLSAHTGADTQVFASTSPIDRARRRDATPGHTLLAHVLDQFAYGVMVVTKSGRLCFANRAALRASTLAQGLQVIRGHVVPTREHERDTFLRALRLAGEGRRSMLTLRGGGSSLTITTLPLGDGCTFEDESAVLLAFGRDTVCESLNEVFFAREYRLTAAECAVLSALCNGLRPGDVAVHCGVAISTIRTQIGSLRNKTGAKHIGDLVRMMTVLPPILPAQI